jgi:hypothetical protein
VKTPKPEVTKAELDAAEADAMAATATLMRFFKAEETTAADLREAERASRTVQKFARLQERAVREYGRRLGV